MKKRDSMKEVYDGIKRLITISERIEEHTKDIVEIKEDIRKNTGDITEMKRDIVEIKEKVGAIEGRMDSMDTS
jgi:peptidoglycan hydrolase CwlO-like protein